MHDYNIMKGYTLHLALCLRAGFEPRTSAARPKGKGKGKDKDDDRRRRLDLDEEDSSGSSAESNTTRALFIGGLPKIYDGPRLQALAARYGRVVSAVVLYGDDCVSRRCGKVLYASSTECQTARAQLADARLCGRTLRVNYWSGGARKAEAMEQCDKLSNTLWSERLLTETRFAQGMQLRSLSSFLSTTKSLRL